MRPDSREAGAMSIQFLILLFLISAIALGAGLMVSVLLSMDKREQDYTDERNTMQNMVDNVCDDIKGDPTPEINWQDDPVWQWNGKDENGYTVTILPLSDSLNLNFIRKNLIEKTSFEDLLKAEQSASMLDQK